LGVNFPAVLRRNHLVLPEKPFAPEQCTWWESLPLSITEQFLVRSDLDTLVFAQKQVEQAVECWKKASAQDERLPLLSQLPGVAMLTAITIKSWQIDQKTLNITSERWQL
jgi:hypothetical protein